MAISHTANLGLPFPDGNEPVSGGPADIQSVVQVLDQGVNGPTASLYRKGTLAARPTATSVTVGAVYHCSDVACAFYSDGAVWHLIQLDGGAPPVGSLMHYGGSADPVDPDGVSRWAICNGRALSRSTYATLFARLGTAYGTGDGLTTFNIPDGRGRFPLGKSTAGTGATLGGTGGAIDHTHPLSSNSGAKLIVLTGGGGYTPYVSQTPNGPTTTIGTPAEPPGPWTPPGASQTGNTIPLLGDTDSQNPPYVVVNHIVRIL